MPSIFENDYFKLYNEHGRIFIRVYKSGFDITSFSNIIKSYPRISIDKFSDFKKEISSPSQKFIDIGHSKQEIEVFISQNKMMAFIKLNMTQEEIDSDKDLNNKIKKLLDEYNIIFGIKEDVFKSQLKPSISILIAEGSRPLNGYDSEIIYRELGDKRPTIKSDGSVDYYDMNFIQGIKKGEWIGEKRPFTSGQTGKTVTGEDVSCTQGKDIKLEYDRLSIEEFEEDGKIVLRSKFDGALKIVDGKISVVKHLVINGDIGYETGNIDFDGSITIIGTVLDNFNVRATKDISINHIMGVGAASNIESKEGSIYIRGGVSGQGKIHISAAKDIFVKYSNSALIEAGNSINIGFYALDSTLTAKRVILSFPKSHIIGGIVNAEIQVVAGSIGSPGEKETIINVTGFDRSKIERRLTYIIEKRKQILKKIEENAITLKYLEETISKIENIHDYEKYKHVMTIHQKLLEVIDLMENEKLYLLDYLRHKNEGEVKILKTAYPKTSIGIKRHHKKIEEETSGGIYYAKDNNLYQGEN